MTCDGFSFFVCNVSQNREENHTRNTTTQKVQKVLNNNQKWSSNGDPKEGYPSTFLCYFIANNGIMAIMFFCEKNIPPCKSFQIIQYWYTFAYFYSSWGPRVAQGCPKGAPRAPETPFCPPQGHPRHHFGAPGSPKWAPKAPFWSPRVTKRHPKSSI